MNSTPPVNRLDPSRLQSRTLELGLEAVEGKRELSDILSDAFQELRAARATIASLQAELQQRDAAPTARSDGNSGHNGNNGQAHEARDAAPAHPDGVEPGQGVGGAAKLRLSLRVPAVVAERSGSAPALFDGPLPDRPDALVAFLRSRIKGAVYVGTLHDGDRLPGIREISRRTSINHKIVRRAYRALEKEALVEVRDRSGIFVSAAVEPPPHRLSETEHWVAGVLLESLERGFGIGAFATLLRQCTRSRLLRCACVDSIEDDRFALCREIEERFGMETIPVPAGAENLAAEIGQADLVVTTPFHADQVREALQPGQPLVVAGLHPAVLAAVQEKTDTDVCTLICVDPASGERLLQGLETTRAARIRLVTAEDRFNGADIATRAARERLNGEALPENLTVPPFLAPPALHAIACLLINLNRTDAPG